MWKSPILTLPEQARAAETTGARDNVSRMLFKRVMPRLSSHLIGFDITGFLYGHKTSKINKTASPET